MIHVAVKYLLKPFNTPPPLAFCPACPPGLHAGFPSIHANNGRCCKSYCSPLRKCSCTVFFIDRQSFDRDKEAAAPHQSYSVLQSIERTVLTRQSFVSHCKSPDPSRVYKEVWCSPVSGLV